MKRTLFKLFKTITMQLYLSYITLELIFARLVKRKVIFILGTPIHQNIGDLAISRAEAEFVQRFIKNSKVIKIPLPLITAKRDRIFTLIRKDDVLTGHGGGNMGDTYPEEETCRREFIQNFPNNRIMIFPQTIHFSSSQDGQAELAKTSNIYAQHKDLTLIAREGVSFDTMKQNFKKNKVILTPDIVLSMNQSLTQLDRQGVLLCLRNDIEAKLDSNDKDKIYSLAQTKFDKVTFTDTISKDRLFFILSKDGIVQNKFHEFKSSKLVITDRLHGMVFAAITGTPCIAMANFNHKVQGTYQWIQDLPYIKFCTDINDLETLLNELDLDKQYTYQPTAFTQYWDKIKASLQ